MRCKFPFWNKDLRIFCPCGKCLGCSINRRRKWTLRIYLESLMHSSSCFVTLTYAVLPDGGNLVPRDLTLFLKRLRKAVSPVKIRYFACGEYGSRTRRPHYHLILFGIGVEYEKVIEKAWSLGMVKVKPTHKDNMEYVAGYCTKKYTGYYEDVKNGLVVKEFTRSSRRPALGVSAMPYLLDKARFQLDGQDVLRSLKIGSVDYPLDRLMRDKLRQAVFTPAEIELIKEVYVEEMQKEAEEMLKAKVGFRWRFMHPQAIGDVASEYYYERYHDVIVAQEKKFALRKKRSLI